MRIAALSLFVAALGFAGVGCTASASVHKADTAPVSSKTQVAYITAPAK